MTMSLVADKVTCSDHSDHCCPMPAHAQWTQGEGAAKVRKVKVWSVAKLNLKVMTRSENSKRFAICQVSRPLTPVDES